ncbi:hypothetical protein LCGC14_1149520 [marine sediment metagenome]|uniref:HNH domain-containing protein n=1 Tax=marine sediment metagenome TaxID=412755 RepID=A0A0F9Q1M9_9ZZZZ
MARIRTIKPEFWTDGTIVRLPFEARLLFIGLWNFADDAGYLPYDPIQLKLQVLPHDMVDAAVLIDLLVAAELLTLHEGVGSRNYLQIKGFDKHQKVSHPQPSRIIPELSGTKRNIPVTLRRALAVKYGCEPGGSAECECYYCGTKGSIWWPTTQTGKPGFWVAFSLSIDHFVAESKGGTTAEDNLVLACESCNKSKATSDGITRMLQNIPEDSGTLPPEGKGIEGNRRDTKIPAQDAGGDSGANDSTTSKGSKPKRRKPVTVDDVKFPPDMDTPEVRTAVDDWLAHKRRRREGYKTPGEVERLLKTHKAVGPAGFVAAVDSSIGNGYKGVCPPTGGNDGRPGNGPGRQVGRSDPTRPRERKYENKSHVPSAASLAAVRGKTSADAKGGEVHRPD